MSKNDENQPLLDKDEAIRTDYTAEGETAGGKQFFFLHLYIFSLPTTKIFHRRIFVFISLPSFSSLSYVLFIFRRVRLNPFRLFCILSSNWLDANFIYVYVMQLVAEKQWVCDYATWVVYF